MLANRTVRRALERGRRRRPRGTRGFTTFELILVLAVVAVLMAIAVPSLEGLVPKYRLRSAVRSLGAKLEFVRVTAISRERWMGMRYVLDTRDDDRHYYQVILPAAEEDPYQAVEDRPVQNRQFLPEGVYIAKIVLTRDLEVSDGTFNVMFSPAGNVGSHAVVLGIEGSDTRFASLKFNCITGTMEYKESADVSFGNFED